MKDFSVSIMLTIPISARNEDQAADRAVEMQDWIKWDPPKKVKWAGDVDYGDPEVEEA